MIPKASCNSKKIGTNKSKQIFKSIFLEGLDRSETALVGQESQGFWEHNKKNRTLRDRLVPALF